MRLPCLEHGAVSQDSGTGGSHSTWLRGRAQWSPALSCRTKKATRRVTGSQPGSEHKFRGVRLPAEVRSVPETPGQKPQLSSLRLWAPRSLGDANTVTTSSKQRDWKGRLGVGWLTQLCDCPS